MKLDNILTTLGTLITLATAAFMLWRARKMFPVEAASGDAGAAKTYAEVAKLAADQITAALTRIDNLEKRGENLMERVDTLQNTLGRRDKCIDALNFEIRRRDNLIEDWTRGIQILIAQILTTGKAPLWKPQLWALPPAAYKDCDPPTTT